MGHLRTHALIDAVNENDQVVGVVDRADLAHAGANFRVAHVVVSNAAGEVLLQHIAPGQRSEGRWGSSAATYVLKDESYAAASRRALTAELGLTDQPRWLGRLAMPDLGGVKFIGVFTVVSEGPFKVPSEQVSEVQFTPRARVASLLAAHPERYTDTFRHVFEFYASISGR